MACLLFLTPVYSSLAGAAPSASASTDQITSVTTAPLSELLIHDRNDAPATIVSVNHSRLSAEITGRALKIRKMAGENVKSGDTLVEIDCRSYQNQKEQAMAALQAAKARLELARKQYQRNLKLRNSKTVSQAALDEASAQQSSAAADIALQEAVLDAARLSIERCIIKAPFDGQITSRQVSQGQLLTPGAPVYKLLQTDNLEIKADLTPQQIFSALRANQLVFENNSLRQPVSIRAIVNEINEATRTQEVRLVISDSNRLAVGMAGRLHWEGTLRLLPAGYVLRRNGKLGVFINEQNTARFIHLPNAREGQPATTSLPDQTAIIDLNRSVIKEGQRIRVQNPE